MARARPWFGRLALAGLRGLLLCAALSVLSVTVLRWLNPPYSAFMAEAQVARLDRPGPLLRVAACLGGPPPHIAQSAARRGCLGGSEISGALGIRRRSHREGLRPEPAQPSRARRQHDQPAGRQEPVSLVRPQLFSQGARGLLHGADRDAVAQAADTRDLPQHRSNSAAASTAPRRPRSISSTRARTGSTAATPLCWPRCCRARSDGRRPRRRATCCSAAIGFSGRCRLSAAPRCWTRSTHTRIRSASAASESPRQYRTAGGYRTGSRGS